MRAASELVMIAPVVDSRKTEICNDREKEEEEEKEDEKKEGEAATRLR